MQYLFLSIYSASSKLVFIAVSDFGAWKKKLFETCQFSPPHSGKGQIPPPRRPYFTNQIPHSLGTENSQMLGVFPGVGMLKFRFDRRTALETSSLLKFDPSELNFFFQCTAKWAFSWLYFELFLDFTFYNSIAHFCISLCVRWRLYSNISQCLISWGKTFSLVNWYGILRTSWPSSVSISLPRRRFEETRVSPPKYESAKNVCVRSKVIVRKVYFTNLELLASFFSLNGCEIMLFHRHREMALLMTMMILITHDLRNPTKKRQGSLNSRIQQGSVDNNPAGERRINQAISSA